MKFKSSKIFVVLINYMIGVHITDVDKFSI